MDIKEAAKAAAPTAKGAKMPSDEAERVVEGARHLSPSLGKRMRGVAMLGKSAFVRELMPQDLKIEVEDLAPDEATELAGFLAGIVGRAHNRQMDKEARAQWQRELKRNRSKSFDAPGMGVEERRRTSPIMRRRILSIGVNMRWSSTPSLRARCRRHPAA